MLISLASTLAVADQVGSGLQIAALVAMVAFGFRQGFFLSLLLALIVLTAAVAGVVLAPGLASQMELLGVPPRLTLPVAYAALLALVVSLGRLAVGATLAEDDMRFRPLADRVGGVLVGACAGMLLGGALLVGWSMCEVPGAGRAESPPMAMDAGARLIWSAVRLMDSSAPSRQFLLDGDPLSRGGEAKVIEASEPFVDVDDDWRRGKDERFLDHDRNGVFTVEQRLVDLPQGTPDVRDTGLLDRYWLSSWKRVRVLHRPRITSPAVGQAPGSTEAEALVYQAQATDVDEHDKLTFRLGGGGDDDESLLQIDPETGDVRFRELTVDPMLEAVRFTIIVTDRSELSAEQEVLVTLNPPPPPTPDSP
ncbi:MAG: CvpA family protein [Planctomycetaceae bacterium]